MTKLLAIDTSGEACSVALSVGDEVRERFEVIPRLHARKLLPMVQSLLAEADVPVTALDAIAFGRGPGSFTGIRICAGVVQGLAFAADVPTVPVSSLAALAQGVYRRHGNEFVLTVLDARMDELYWAGYQLVDGYASLLGEEQLTAPAVLDQTQSVLAAGCNWVSVGDGWKFSEQFPTHITSAVRLLDDNCYVQAQDIIRLAQKDYAAGLYLPAEQALPVYLRDKTAWRKTGEQ